MGHCKTAVIGKDCVPANIFNSVISKPVMHSYIISFNTRVFPSRMKMAKIMPISKSDAKTDIGNYRPISLSLRFSKHLERLFLTSLDNFINAKDILNSSEYAFLAMSTSHTILELRGNFKCNGQ